MSTTATYRISLFDHELDRWSLSLARDHLEGPSVGLSWREMGRALRRLRRQWDDLSILVEAE